jgi:hypothetical protein
MSTDDRKRRTARLAEAAAARSADAAARARRAITKLRTAGQPITFVAVTRTAGVSTSFLYQNAQIRGAITAHRTTSATPATTRAGSPASAESLRTKFATATARNRELTEQLAQLRLENEALRSRLLGH